LLIFLFPAHARLHSRQPLVLTPCVKLTRDNGLTIKAHICLLTGRSKTAICCVSEKIQAAYLRMTARPGFYRFLASHHFWVACEF
jgi:hypothetical protein